MSLSTGPPHESSPQPTGTSIAKVIVPIDVSHTVNGNNLEELPEEVEWETAVGLGDVGLEYYQPRVGTMCSSHMEKPCAEIVEVVKRDSDILTWDERVW
jgi:hypothetical protein